jgi:hypothetical protein
MREFERGVFIGTLPTEKAARQRWCPFGRMSDTEEHPASINRNDDGSPRALCLASVCMAWRFVVSQGERQDERRGYCGLAGGPS